jgi:hypothetical protein
LTQRLVSRQAAFERLVKLTGRLERLCGEYLQAYIDIGDVANNEELKQSLERLELANAGIVEWIRKARGLKLDSRVYTHKDVTNVLKDRDATKKNLRETSEEPGKKGRNCYSGGLTITAEAQRTPC